MTKETKVGLVIGLVFILTVVYLLHWATNPTESELQASHHRAEVDYESLQQSQIDRPQILSAVKKTPLFPVKPAPDAQLPDLQKAPPIIPKLPTLAKAPEPKQRFYIVKSGQTLTDIAREVYGPQHTNEWRRIHLANKYKLASPHLLKPNLKLLIPPLAQDKSIPTKSPLTARRDTTYTVMPGDTLSQISTKKLGTSRRWEEILDLNRDKLPDEYSLRAGMVLKLPALSKLSRSNLGLPQALEDLD